VDNYVYVSVKLSLQKGQTEDSIQEIIQEMDYSFEHSDIIDHEIIDIVDTQVDTITIKERHQAKVPEGSKTMSKNVNTLINRSNNGTSQYNELGNEIDRRVYEAVKAILDEAIEEHGPLDIRMFALIAMCAVQEVNLEKQF
jgi:hypothetical protein